MIVCTSVYIYIYIYIYNCVFGSLISHVTCNYLCWWGKGWPVVACPSRALVVLYRMLTIFACYLLTCLGCCIYFPSSPYDVFVHGLCFLNNGLNKFLWTSYLHAILRIVSRGVSGLATGSPCGVWGLEWTICFLHDSPLFGSHFSVLVCEFGVRFHIFIIISCLGSWFHAWN